VAATEPARADPFIADAMLAMGLKFDLILSSPYVRAADTAQIVASHLDEEVTFTDFLIPDGNPLELIREINDARVQRVLLVGHEPDLGLLEQSSPIGAHALRYDVSDDRVDLNGRDRLSAAIERLKHLAARP